MRNFRRVEAPVNAERQPPLVSIVIKALNEERHIASAIESALVAIDEVGGEVILADSASTDRTVEIARSYPIKIVQMTNVEDRSCGAGAQLGYQHSRGRYVCLIDGDMKLRPGFLPAAVRHLEACGTLAGVGGMIVEAATGNREFEQRARRDEPDRRPGGSCGSTAAGSTAAPRSTRWVTSPTAIFTAARRASSAPACARGAGRWNASTFRRSITAAIPAMPTAC